MKSSHKGNLGHWLESRLGGKVDADGNADLDGYECKVESKKPHGETGGLHIEYFVTSLIKSLIKICVPKYVGFG